MNQAPLISNYNTVTIIKIQDTGRKNTYKQFNRVESPEIKTCNLWAINL